MLCVGLTALGVLASVSLHTELSCEYIWFTFEHVINLSTRLRCHSHLVCALEALAHILLSTGMNDQFPSKGRKSSTRRLGLGPACNFYSWLFCLVYISFYILYFFLPSVFLALIQPAISIRGDFYLYICLFVFLQYILLNTYCPRCYMKSLINWITIAIFKCALVVFAAVTVSIVLALALSCIVVWMF